MQQSTQQTDYMTANRQQQKGIIFFLVTEQLKTMFNAITKFHPSSS
jgi:hypothetical protein